MFSFKNLINNVCNTVTNAANNASTALRAEPTQSAPSAMKAVIVETGSAICYSVQATYSGHLDNKIASENIKDVTTTKEEKKEYLESQKSAATVALEVNAHLAAKAARIAALDLIRHTRCVGMTILRKLRITNVCSWIKTQASKLGKKANALVVVSPVVEVKSKSVPHGTGATATV